MQPPERPQNETQRLNALYERAILDTPAEERFDRITRLAQRLFEVPIALVSLVDEQRQWFKSRQGLDVCETGRDVSFCAHTILEEDILAVNDAATDPRFANNPLVTGEPHIRFYAGAPLATRDGYRIGTLCIIDTRPRELTPSQRLALRELADCVQDEINLRQDRELASLLAASQARHLGILTALPDMVFVVDQAGRFIDCHDHPDLLMPREQLLRTSIPNTLPAHVAERAMAAIRDTLQTGETVAFEYDLDIPAGPASFEARVRRINADQALIIIRNITRQKQAETALHEQQRITAMIAHAQASFISEPDQREAFDTLLGDILALTHSEYGFIGEVLHTPGGEPYLKTHAITNIAWNADTRAFYEANAPQGLVFTNLKTLFGAVVTSGEAVIANAPATDPRRGGLPDGHPPLKAFLGLPVHHGSEMVAMLGIANRPGGYDQALIEFLDPLLLTLGQLIIAARMKRRLEDNQAELARLSRVASQTINGVIITDTEARVEWINEGFTRISGYTLDEMRGRKPGELLQGPDTDPETVAVMREAICRGKPFQVDILNYTRDGQPYWIRIQSSPMYDSAGQITNFMAIETDITHERQAREEVEHHLQGLAVLNEIASLPAQDVDQQLTLALSLGARHLGMEIGVIGEAQRETFRIRWLVAPENVDLRVGQAFPLQDTYHHLAIAGSDLDSIHHLGASDYRSHPSYLANGVESYISIPLQVSGQLFGTLSFSSSKARTNPFKESEREFIRLLSRWVAVTLEKQKSHEQLQKLVSHIPGMVYQYQQWPDGRGALPYSSPGILDIYGVHPEEVRENAAAVYRVIHPDDLHAVAQSIKRSMQDLSTWHLQYRTLRYNGRVRWLEGHATPEAMADGSTLWHGYIRDITQQKHAELAMARSEARLRGLFELSPVGIALNDFETGNFLEVNEALLRSSGYSQDEFMTLSYWDLTPREYEAQERLQLESLEKTGQYGPYEKEYIRKDGSRYPVLLHGMVVLDTNGRKLIWSIIEDISERKRLERMKSEFVSTVSHELRTPLTSIAAALGLIQGGAMGEIPENVRQLVQLAHKNSQRLTYLINDLLDMEKLMAGKMRFNLQPQALMPLVKQAMTDNRPYADQFDVAFSLTSRQDDVMVNVDAQRLHQILTNLLSNAAKFSPEGAQVEIAVTRIDDQVRIAVKDRGPGIPADFQAHLFEKFSQADGSNTRKRSGTGLGLAITRELVQRMGGSIGFESVEGQGSCFHIDLPIWNEQQGGDNPETRHNEGTEP
nr:PAS domain S-box protein [Thioalkalivibrio sulfidiphilus]